MKPNKRVKIQINRLQRKLQLFTWKLEATKKNEKRKKNRRKISRQFTFGGLFIHLKKNVTIAQNCSTSIIWLYEFSYFFKIYSLIFFAISFLIKQNQQQQKICTKFQKVIKSRKISLHKNAGCQARSTGEMSFFIFDWSLWRGFNLV